MQGRGLAKELERARLALTEPSPAHGLSHLANAFELAPFDERVLALFEDLARRVDILSHVDGPAHLGAAVLQAHAQRRVGRIDEAVTKLALVVEQFPDRGLESLLAAWLFACKAEGRALGPGAASRPTTSSRSRSRASPCARWAVARRLRRPSRPRPSSTPPPRT